MVTQDYKIAPGFNNTAGYVTIEATAVSGKYFSHIQGLGTYDPGEERVYVDGTRDDVGEGFFTWLITKMTIAQYEYLIATPNAGRRSNRVTARTRLNGLTFVNTNSILTVPKTVNLTRAYGYYLDVPLAFSLIAII